MRLSSLYMSVSSSPRKIGHPSKAVKIRKSILDQRPVRKVNQIIIKPSPLVSKMSNYVTKAKLKLSSNLKLKHVKS